MAKRADDVWDTIDLWGFLAGIGLFLLGMFMIEQGFKGLASQPLKRFLRNQTRSPLRGAVTGTVATFVLQSSTVVSLIVLAFVGAGILELRNALGVIFGANLGTTLKGWVVATLGFTLDLDAWAEPMLALGAVGTVFLAAGRKPHYYANLLLGLGLLLAGLEDMKDAFEHLADGIDTSLLAGHHPLTYVITGAIFTAIIQSSSATMMILLSALHAGVIDLAAAAALTLGADLGTTSTIVLGAAKGTPDKRRVAACHVLFNVFTTSAAFLLMPALLYVVTGIFGITDPLYALVAFHSGYNLMGVTVFVILTEPFRRLLVRLIPDTAPPPACRHIPRVPPTVTDAAIEAVRHDLRLFLARCLSFNLVAAGLSPRRILAGTPGGDNDAQDADTDAYETLKHMAGELLAYTYTVQGNPMDADDARALTELNHAVRNVGYAAKHIKDVRHNFAAFLDSDSAAVQEYLGEFQARLADLHRRAARLLAMDAGEQTAHEYLELMRDSRAAYDRAHERIYARAGRGGLPGALLSSLFNTNRAIYQCMAAILEALRVLLEVERTAIMQTPEAMLQLGGEPGA